MLYFNLFAIIFIIIYIILFFTNLKKKTLIELLSFTVFYIYIALVINLTLFDIPIDKNLINENKSFGLESKYNFIPLNSIIEIIHRNINSPSIILRQIGGNLVLLTPFAFCLPMFIKNLTMKKIIALTATMSAFIEILQLLIGLLINYKYRVVDIDDFFLNLIGGIIGCIIYQIFKFIVTRLKIALLEPLFK